MLQLDEKKKKTNVLFKAHCLSSEDNFDYKDIFLVMLTPSRPESVAIIWKMTAEPNNKRKSRQALSLLFLYTAISSAG